MICKYSLKKRFSTYVYHNFPITSKYYINGELQLFDSNIQYYKSKYIEALLQKRWILKHEVPPKISIMNYPAEYKNTINNQNNISLEGSKIEKKFSDMSEQLMSYLYEKTYINSCYIINQFFEENEINMFKQIQGRIFMNGFQCFKEDNNKFLENDKKIKNLVNVFFQGEKLSEFEKTIEMIYLIYKFTRCVRSFRYKEKISFFTQSNLMNSIGYVFYQSSYVQNYFKFKKTEVQPINLAKILHTWHLIKTSSVSLWNKLLFKILSNKYVVVDLMQNKIIAQHIMVKITLFLESMEFYKVFDLEMDFYISHSIMSMHIWLICQRLQNFKRSKDANEITKEILDIHKKISNQAFQGVDTLRKIYKFKFIEEVFEVQKRQLHWHFLINNTTTENPYYKIDSLVWSFIFREKIPRYDDRVYKMSHYLIKHYQLLKNKSLEDFESLNFDFNINVIPVNFKDEIVLINKPIVGDQLYKEQYSNFNNKLYSYNYMNETDQNKINLKKSFVRYTDFQSFDKRNYFLRSKRQSDKQYDELKDEVKITELKSKLESQNYGLYDRLFNYWVNKVYAKENKKRCDDMYIILKEIPLSTDLISKKEGKNNMKSKKELKDEEKNLFYSGTEKSLLKIRLSETFCDNSTKELLYKYRYNLFTNKKVLDDKYVINSETKMLYKNSNVITNRRKRKSMVDNIFRLKN